MSIRALVIPEDPTWNGYILKPLARALLEHAGRPNAKVKLLENPRVQGYDQARSVIRHSLPDIYGFFYDLWLFFPDADRATPGAMADLEADLGSLGISLLCCPAEPEVEIYACAAFLDDLPGTWEDARTNARLKEEIFQPLLARHGDRRRPGEG